MRDFNYQKVGEDRLDKFVKTIQQLFAKNNYDLVIGVGNTGLVMIRFTQLILNELKITMPPVLALPLLRFSDDNEKELFNNDIFLKEAKKQLEGIEKIENILFVDDEIYRGISVKTAIRLVMKAQNLDKLNITVVAEDHGFQWDNAISNVTFNFFPFTKLIKGHNNVIFYLIPSEFNEPLKRLFPENILKWYTRMNILLDLPVKMKTDGKAEFTYKCNEEAEEKIKNFEELQEKFLSHLQKLIQNGVK